MGTRLAGDDMSIKNSEFFNGGRGLFIFNADNTIVDNVQAHNC